MSDLFKCKPIATILSRSACGARYERRIGATCSTCAVGRQHARGALPTTWPDGTELVTAAITVATMASLRVHLAIIESHTPPPMRGARIDGATIREHAERARLHPQVIRQRILRGEDPATAIEPRLRGTGRYPTVEVQVGDETLTLRALARRIGKDSKTVSRWVKRGLGVAQIMERCA
jgi:hypothetical protein